MPVPLVHRTIVRTRQQPVIRPVQCHEGDAVVDAVFAGLSARSRFLRFHSPIPRLPATVREKLAAVDGRRHAAVVAQVREADGATTTIGVARVIGDGRGRAELAVAVVDDWQRRGIGRRLLAAVADLAETIGYTELVGTVVPENVGMLALARRLFPGVRPRYDGEAVQLVIPLGAAAWTITHEDLMADLLASAF